MNRFKHCLYALLLAFLASGCGGSNTPEPAENMAVQPAEAMAQQETTSQRSSESVAPEPSESTAPDALPDTATHWAESLLIGFVLIGIASAIRRDRHSA